MINSSLQDYHRRFTRDSRRDVLIEGNFDRVFVFCCAVFAIALNRATVRHMDRLGSLYLNESMKP